MGCQYEKWSKQSAGVRRSSAKHGFKAESNLQGDYIRIEQLGQPGSCRLRRKLSFDDQAPNDLGLLVFQNSVDINLFDYPFCGDCERFDSESPRLDANAPPHED